MPHCVGGGQHRRLTVNALCPVLLLNAHISLAMLSKPMPDAETPCALKDATDDQVRLVNLYCHHRCGDGEK